MLSISVMHKTNISMVFLIAVLPVGACICVVLLLSPVALSSLSLGVISSTGFVSLIVLCGLVFPDVAMNKASCELHKFCIQTYITINYV